LKINGQYRTPERRRTCIFFYIKIYPGYYPT
jgi:hypothetical protein